METKQRQKQHSGQSLANNYSANLPTSKYSSFTICYCLALSFSIIATIVAVFITASPRSSATEQATAANASVNVSAVCKMTGTTVTPHTATVMNDTYTTDIGKTTLKSFCNDASGYSIYAVGFGNNTVGNNVLHSNSIGSTYDIPTGTSGSGSEWSMKVSSVAGTYAPSIDNNFNNYHSVPDRYTRVAYLGNSTDATTGSSVETTYAVRISGTQPAGTYQGKVKYILVHPSGDTPEVVPIMQNVATWKETLLENEEITVKDARDNQTYTVAKLCVAKSGSNCTDWQIWMTQNLNFAPDATKTYTHADTDLGYTTSDPTATWQPLASTMTNPAIISDYTPAGSATTAVSGWTNDNSLPHYAEGTLNGTEVLSYNGTTYIGMQACINAGHTASQCEHYKIGNYYNWPAAIASNNASSISAQYAVAPDSVCPAGWRLPQGPTASTPSEFNKMFYANDVAANLNDYTGTGVNVQYATDGFTKINTNPHYFARSGRVYGTTLYYFAGDGRYWSSSTMSSSFAYDLLFNSGGLYPADQYFRSSGFSLRCVAR